MPYCFINSPCRYVAKQFLSHSCTHDSRTTGLPSFSCTLTLQKWQRECCLWLHHCNMPTRKQWELICVIIFIFCSSSAWSSCWKRVRPFDMVQPRTIPQALGGRTCTYAIPHTHLSLLDVNEPRIYSQSGVIGVNREWLLCKDGRRWRLYYSSLQRRTPHGHLTNTD